MTCHERRVPLPVPEVPTMQPSTSTQFTVARPSSAEGPHRGTQSHGVAGIRLATHLVVLFACALLAVWLWSRICRFPSIPWNDMRLAPTIALSQGWPVYPSAVEGTINTWMYGPLPLLFFWPATWAETAADALMVAAVLNAALTLVPLAFVCFCWPTATSPSKNIVGRTAAFLLCLALWPELHYSVHFSDNLAVACGLLSNLMLVRARTSRELWVIAFVATAAIACKQISLGIPLAQVLWIGMTIGRRAAMLQVMRCVVAGALIGGAAIMTFGWQGLWFTLVEVPGGLVWAPEPVKRMLMVAGELALYIGLPAVIMIVRRRTFAQPTLLLPALAWICVLPLGLAGFLKVGGWINSIYSFVLWFPPVITTFLTAQFPERRLRIAQLTAAVIAAAVASVRVTQEQDLPLRPQTAAYRDAERLVVQFPGALWFPVHPLITLYSDRRYYHDEDGLYARVKANKVITPSHANNHLPSAMRGMAFRNGWSDWGIARSMLPPSSRGSDLGYWTLWGGTHEKPQP
jgi:hypothetical protein